MLFIGLFLAANTVHSGLEIAWALALIFSFLLLLSRPTPLAIPRQLARILIFPTLLFCTGLHGVYTHPPADVLKDLWYFAGPIVYITFGFLVFQRVDTGEQAPWQSLLQPFLVVALISGLYDIFNVLTNSAALLASTSVDDYRNLSGTGSYVVLIPIVLIVLLRQHDQTTHGLERFRLVRVLVYLSSVGSILLALSRTLIVMLFSGVALAVNPRRMARRLLAQGGLGALALLLAVAAAGYGLSRAKTSIPELFAAKLLNTRAEVQVRGYETFSQINENWRGFEAFRALRTYQNFNPAQKLAGGGFGATVDLGFATRIYPTQYIPIIHNGYMYLLVKTGLVGLVFFCCFLGQILSLALRTFRHPEPNIRIAALLLLWSAIVFASTQAVITGIYNKGALAGNLFLLGAACASLAAHRPIEPASAQEPASPTHLLQT